MSEHVPTPLDVWASQPFQSNAEQQTAFASPRYKDPQDQAFRDAVAAKLAITSYPDQPKTASVGGVISSVSGANVGRGALVVASGEMERFQKLAEERKQAEEQKTLAAENHRRLAAALKIPELHELDASRPVAPFATRAEMKRHISDPRYSRDEAFRQYVEARTIASDFSDTPE